MKPYILAEIGSNYRISDNQDDNLICALKHIHAAKECGCDCAKFQYYTHEKLYGIPGDDTYAMPQKWLQKLAAECRKIGIDFMVSVFDPADVALVDPYVKMHKIACSENNYSELIKAVSDTKKEYFVSLQANTQYIEDDPKFNPMLCVPKYPALLSDYNIIRHIQSWGCLSAISDHTTNNDLAIICASRGCIYFEKHFRLDDITNTPDAEVSICPTQMQKYIRSIKDVCAAISEYKYYDNPHQRRHLSHGFYRKKYN